MFIYCSLETGHTEKVYLVRVMLDMVSGFHDLLAPLWGSSRLPVAGGTIIDKREMGEPGKGMCLATVLGPKVGAGDLTHYAIEL